MNYEVVYLRWLRETVPGTMFTLTASTSMACCAVDVRVRECRGRSAVKDAVKKQAQHRTLLRSYSSPTWHVYPSRRCIHRSVWTGHRGDPDLPGLHISNSSMSPEGNSLSGRQGCLHWSL